MKTTIQDIEFIRINNDVNGNPRYVCHFLNLLTPEDEKRAGEDAPYMSRPGSVSTLYQMAINKAKKIGGRKFHNKQYGGGIVFQSYNLNETARQIVELKNA